MQQTNGSTEGREGARWLQDNPQVIEQAIEAIGLTMEQLKDDLVRNPERLVNLAGQAVQEAINNGAPAHIIEDLRGQHNKMRNGVRKLLRSEFLMNSLAQLQGLRDRDEIEPVLKRAADQAPDERTRRILQDAVASMDEVMDPMRLGEAAGPRRPACGGCCVLACVACREWCYQCCVMGCMMCQ